MSPARKRSCVRCRSRPDHPSPKAGHPHVRPSQPSGRARAKQARPALCRTGVPEPSQARITRRCGDFSRQDARMSLCAAGAVPCTKRQRNGRRMEQLRRTRDLLASWREARIPIPSAPAREQTCDGPCLRCPVGRPPFDPATLRHASAKGGTSRAAIRAEPVRHGRAKQRRPTIRPQEGTRQHVAT